MKFFGGYPWFFKKDSLENTMFPWLTAIDERSNLINPDIVNNFNMQEYIRFRFDESLAEIDFGAIDEATNIKTLRNTKGNKKKDLFHLNYYWFMQTLLERADKMSTYSDLEIRVPFCDHRLVEYAWNIPWDMKSLNGREKGLLRHIAQDILPDEIVERKKSPYPKTHNPSYLTKVKEMLGTILDDSNAPINNLLNKDYLREILDTEGKAFNKPWFGQLMTGPQLMAYLIQFNMWLDIYKPRIEL